jgi:type I restriction enzyme S subunit
MSFPRYPKYKPSGVEWLGDVPEHWSVLPCRAIVQERTAKNDDARCQDYLSLMANVGVIPYAEKGDIGNKKPEDLSKCKIVTRGDFVINSMNYGIGSYGLSDYDGVCSSVYIVLKPKNDIVESRFAFRIFEGRSFQKFAQSFGNGILDHRSAINWDILKSIGVGIPSLEEQQSILEFLDRETAKIDGLVAEQRRLMELLKEKRQAVISHAVTKGLNPHAPMKPSGIEWLGDVPEHWAVRKISQLFRAGKGKNGQMLTKEFCGANEGDYPVYSGQTENEGVMGTWDQFEFDFGEAGVLFSTTVGAKAMHLRQLFGRFSLSQNCMIIWTTSALCITRFFYYHFQPLFQWQRSMIPDHMQPSFRMEDLYACAIALPPTDEQSAIVAFLDSELLKFDTLTAEAQRAIDLLQERRTALISAAVTGQIDVRQHPKN